MLSLSVSVALLFLPCFIVAGICCGEYYVGCLQFECFPVYAYVCFVFDCVW